MVLGAAQTHLRFTCQPDFERSENPRNAITPWTVPQYVQELSVINGVSEGIGVGTCEPMASTAQQSVSGSGIALEIPGLQEVMQP